MNSTQSLKQRHCVFSKLLSPVGAFALATIRHDSSLAPSPGEYTTHEVERTVPVQPQALRITELTLTLANPSQNPLHSLALTCCSDRYLFLAAVVGGEGQHATQTQRTVGQSKFWFGRHVSCATVTGKSNLECFTAAIMNKLSEPAT